MSTTRSLAALTAGGVAMRGMVVACMACVVVPGMVVVTMAGMVLHGLVMRGLGMLMAGTVMTVAHRPLFLAAHRHIRLPEGLHR